MPTTVTTMTARALLGQVPFFRTLIPAALDELLAASELRNYRPKQMLFAELEPGDELLVSLEGRAAISVGSGEIGGEEQLGEVGPGAIVGEIALLTGSLRSANVIALEEVAALALGRRKLHSLMRRFPELARQFMILLSERLGTAEEVLGRALDPTRAPATPLEGLGQEAHRIAARRRPLGRLLGRAFQELVVEHAGELPFYLLSGFLVAAAGARLWIWALATLGVPLQLLLRGAYVLGLVALLFAGGAAPFTFRRRALRALCLLFGAGAGLVVNELSVWLAFDIFYRDVFTRDPNVAFDPGLLYRRSESFWVFSLALVALVQATYFRHFYRRAYYLVVEHWESRVHRPRNP